MDRDTEVAAETAALAATLDAQVDAAEGDVAATKVVQGRAIEAIYERLDLDQAVVAPLNAVYTRCVEALEAALGPGAHVGEVDPDLFEVLHNVHKSERGFRPGFHTRASALAWLEPFRRAA